MLPMIGEEFWSGYSCLEPGLFWTIEVLLHPCPSVITSTYLQDYSWVLRGLCLLNVGIRMLILAWGWKRQQLHNELCLLTNETFIHVGWKVEHMPTVMEWGAPCFKEMFTFTKRLYMHKPSLLSSGLPVKNGYLCLEELLTVDCWVGER